MRFRVTVRKLNVISRASGATGDNKRDLPSRASGATGDNKQHDLPSRASGATGDNKLNVISRPGPPAPREIIN